MLSSNKLKYLRSLHLRKFRQKYHNFIVEGEKMVSEVLADGSLKLEEIFGLREWAEANAPLLKVFGSRFTEVSQADLKKVSLLSSPNQVLLVLRQPSNDFDAQIASSELSLYLDDIRDPGNLGTILRIADWFGIRYVFRSVGSVEAFNPKVVQASMGAFLRVSSPEVAFGELRSALPNLPVFGTVLGGRSLFEMDLPKAALLVIGNESKGIGEDLLPQLTHQIAIPKGERGGAESLNAAVATGIVCSMFRRRS